MKFFRLLLVALSLVSISADAQVNGVSAEVTLEQPQFLPNEELMMAVKITNLSGRPIVMGDNRRWISFNVDSIDNLVVQRISEPRIDGELELKSSLSGTRRWNLSDYFELSQPGRYKVSVTIKLPEWGDRSLTTKPVSFDIVQGTKLKEIDFGLPLPPGASNAVPETRKYIIQQAPYLEKLKLYFRLTDSRGAKTYKVFPLGQMLSFSKPEVQIDRLSNLHVLHQTGARAFNYAIINPDGAILQRQTHDYTHTRPVLRGDAEGEVRVTGGVRRMTANDVPKPIAQSAETDARLETR